MVSAFPTFYGRIYVCRFYEKLQPNVQRGIEQQQPSAIPTLVSSVPSTTDSSDLAFSEPLFQTDLNYEDHKGNHPSSPPKRGHHLVADFSSRTPKLSILKSGTDSVFEDLRVNLTPLIGPFEHGKPELQLPTLSQDLPIANFPSSLQTSEPVFAPVHMSSDGLFANSFGESPKTPNMHIAMTSIDSFPQFPPNLTSPQLLWVNSIPDALNRLQHGHESYSLIRNLMCSPKDSIEFVLDMWFLDIYRAIEELLLGNSVSNPHELILSRLEDGLMILRFLLKHQFHRFSSLKSRLFMLLFKLYHHSSPTIVCASEDLWSILFENHEYSDHIFDFLKTQLEVASLSSNGEMPVHMALVSALSSMWSLLALFARHLSPDKLCDYVEQDLATQFTWTIRHHRIEVRKSIVDFLVVCYSRIGTSFDRYTSELSMTERKLVQMYMDRK